jgi:SAM-dependent methyltransferase
MFPGHDPEALQRQYGNDAYLRIRHEIHDQYSVPRVDFPNWVLDRLVWRGDERVLDVGTGHGAYYERLRERVPTMHYYGLDRSPGMLHNHGARGNLLVADAQQLPFKTATFDVVMANHMLYHVPDMDRAVEEFRRVLKPDGTLVTATNSLQTMPEFDALFRRAIMLLSAPGSIYTQSPTPMHNPFALENGVRVLAHHFYAVARHDLPQALVFDKVEPAMAYLESWRPLRELQLPGEVFWDDVMLVMREQIARVINHFGELVVNKVSGVLMASDEGGFIRGFMETSSQLNGRSPR